MKIKFEKRHQRYAYYKNSGVEWLGEVPEGWEIRKLKFCSSKSFKYGANEAALDEDKTQPRFVRITDVDKNGNLKDKTFKSLEYNIAKDFLLDEGDILFARSGATVGKTFQYKESWGKCCFAGYLIKFSPNSKILFSDFAKYVVNSKYYEDWKNSIFVQATIQNISAEKYKSFLISFPNIKEQTTIANHLDEKTALLDSIIKKKQRQIELLKERRSALINRVVTKGLDAGVEMKDSEVEWIGKVPKGWKVRKLKFIAKIDTGGKDTQDNKPAGKYPFFVRSDIVEKIDTFSCNEEAVLTAGDGVGVGKVFHYYDGKFDFHQRVYKISNFRGMLGKFFFYYVKDNFAKEVIKLSAKSTVDSLRRPMFTNFPVLIPLLPEQEKIVHYIGTKTQKIDKTIALVEKSIALIQEYKTSLISNVVTGKVRVV